ncbi:MAG TPA: phosphoribosylamine--glycine ligase, partial [Planctomycetota bacterium]|nr:phosphoribosylamine--glycine ligase [Planctomycetota bacterium]
RQAGMRTAPVTRFTDVPSAIAYIKRRPRRYVCKHNGHSHPSTHNHVGQLEDGTDVIAVLRQYERSAPGALDVVLMDFIDGVETGIGAYFDGRRFIGPVCLDWEHKRFFPGDLGELTGEMGTVVTYRGSERLFRETLAPMAPLLAEHGYCGYLNLNTIINEDGIWPLEFTCRFGYPGFAILDALHVDGWENILRALCGAEVHIPTYPGYAVGVVLTVPPFPYLADPPPSRGLPISFRGALTLEDRRNVHFGEVDFSSGDPVVGGASGYVLVVTGRGDDVAAARSAAYRLVDRTVVPNVRYRADIGCRFLERDGALLRRLGYLPAAGLLTSMVR